MEMCSWQWVGDGTLRLPQPAEIKHKRCRETESPTNCRTVVHEQWIQCHCSRDQILITCSKVTAALSLSLSTDLMTVTPFSYPSIHPAMTISQHETYFTYEFSFTFAGVSVVSINKTDMTDKILDTKVIAAQRQVKSAAHISEPYGGTQVLKSSCSRSVCLCR